MSIVTAVWALGAIAASGALLTLLTPLGGLIVANAGCAVAGFTATRQNTPFVRLGYYLGVVALSFALLFVTGSRYLSLSALAFGLPLHAVEPVMRRWKLHHLQPTVGWVVGVALLILSRSVGWWLLGVAPIFLLSTLVSGANLLHVVAAGGIVGRAPIAVGEPLPEVELPFRDGEGTFKLSAHRGRHVLLCFLRGDWCPICHVLMRILMREAPLLKRHDVHVVLITPTSGEMDLQLHQSVGLSLQMALDEGARLARAFGLIEGRRHGEDVPLPVALLVAPDGLLLDISRPDDVTAFTSESRIAAILRERGDPAAPATTPGRVPAPPTRPG